MNQARSLVHVYTDGSVAVSTARWKWAGRKHEICASRGANFFAANRRIRVHPTNTLRIANTSPTAGVRRRRFERARRRRLPVKTILQRLKEVAAPLIEARTADDVSIENGFVFRNGERTDLDWLVLINEAHFNRVSLSEHAHYATAGIHFDWGTAKGHPFAYHVYGTAAVGVTVDCLRGIYTIDYVKACHDFGTTMNTAVDFGQIEGGIVQGIGWMTLEEVVYDGNGKLRSNALSTDKIPDIYPCRKRLKFCRSNDARKSGIFNSKRRRAAVIRHGAYLRFVRLRALILKTRPRLTRRSRTPKEFENLYTKAVRKADVFKLQQNR